MKRYAESKTQDEVGDMQDGVYESPHGEYIRIDDLIAWLDGEIDPGETGWNAAIEAVKERITINP